MLAHPLDGSRGKSGISPSAPQSPQASAHRLPPILRRPQPPPVPSCSKAPRGLFVLSRVLRIFTERAISPSPSSRQRPDRYTIRAGRNLPDKEFRYLRTVIVTAAVHWGFGSRLSPLPLTFQHWAGVSPYTSACAFAETCVFGKQSPGPFPAPPSRTRLTPASSCDEEDSGRHHQGDAFSRSYGVNLPSSLTRGRSTTSALMRQPTCVGLRYGHAAVLPPWLFLPAQVPPCRFARKRRSPTPLAPPRLRRPKPRRLGRTLSIRHARLPSLGPHDDQQTLSGAGILTSSPSPTADALGLGPTNPPRTNLPEEPLGFRWADFSSAFTLLMPAFALPTAPAALTNHLHR